MATPNRDALIERILGQLVERTITNTLDALSGRDRALLEDPVFQAGQRATLRDTFGPVATAAADRLLARAAAKADPPPRPSTRPSTRPSARPSTDPLVTHIVACLEGDPIAQGIQRKLATASDAEALRVVTQELLPIVVRCARSWELAA